MPYIALQLIGIQAVLEVLGLGSSGNWLGKDAPLLIAFVLLAAYTYTSGLRAPAVIAFVKDALIYLVIIVAIVYLPAKVGGWAHIFGAAQQHMAATNPATHKATGVFIPVPGTMWAYATLGLGSALALFMYPHSITATLSSGSRNTIRRNSAVLPAYSLMLALLALLGFAAIAKQIPVFGQDGYANPQLAVPHLFDEIFPSWFAGVCFAAIAIGALVPAAIMSIAAANLFTRNIYREFIKSDATPKHEAQVSKIVSLIVKFGALVFALGLDRQNAINFQLLGGVWILQTIVSIVAGLYTRWFHRWALLAGWAAGMIYGTIVAYQQTVPNAKTRLVDGKPVTTVNGMRHFGSSLADFPFTHQKVYIAVSALVVNLLVAVVLTLLLRAVKAPAGTDGTRPEHYHADAPDPRVHETAVATTAGAEPTTG
ncbi:MAG TPA: sodium:solute symporter, partial [Jatrophihabitans sp.]|nr:sodium:solute symporter [Jatrophihabitans sp.]